MGVTVLKTWWLTCTFPPSPMPSKIPFMSLTILSIQRSLLYLQMFLKYPILDTRIFCPVRLREPPQDSAMGWTGELWSNHVLLILKKLRGKHIFLHFFRGTKKYIKNFPIQKSDLLRIFQIFFSGLA